MFDEQTKKEYKIITIRGKNYKDLFHVPDGANMTVRYPDGREHTAPCKYLDNYHFLWGSFTFHIDQFAEWITQRGAIAEPDTFVTDPKAYPKKYMDRELKDKDGKIIPYREFFRKDNEHDYYAYPNLSICWCADADPEKRFCISGKLDSQETQEGIFKVFSSRASFPDKLMDVLSATNNQAYISSVESKQINAFIQANCTEQIRGHRPSLGDRLQKANAERKPLDRKGSVITKDGMEH